MNWRGVKMQREVNEVKKIEDEDLQMAENIEIDETDKRDTSEYEEKRAFLEKTKINKQSWSIREILKKIRDNDLILDPRYQRNVVWTTEKKVAFIESLYMEIMIPPIYVVEVPSDDLLDTNKYEVVDGKQRLSTIKEFFGNELELKEKYLEYYGDVFGGKTFSAIKNAEDSKSKTEQMLSSILDIYVITSESPVFTKYDIFARLNKGAEPLKVNEIRRAIYQSDTTKIIDDFISQRVGESAEPQLKEEYVAIFSEATIKRYYDYGRFYKSVAFFVKTNQDECYVEGYNSRPRDMINLVLQDLQNKKITIERETVENILNNTIELMKLFNTHKYSEHLVDACIPFSNEKMDTIIEKAELIEKDEKIKQTLEKSQSSTNNVNDRIKRVKEIIMG